jgi:hypothetical protein
MFVNKVSDIAYTLKSSQSNATLQNGLWIIINIWTLQRTSERGSEKSLVEIDCNSITVDDVKLTFSALKCEIYFT